MASVHVVPTYNILGTVSTAVLILTPLSRQPHKGVTTLVSILKIEKLRHRRVK